MTIDSIAFDTETTGLDSRNSEIVSAAIVSRGQKDGSFNLTQWLLKTSVRSSEQALAKHGISWEEQQAEGEDYVESIDGISSMLLGFDGYVVTMNGTFDMTMLQGSLDRYEVDKDVSGVRMVDVMVLDRFIDPYRKGRRNLESLAEHYGIVADHDFHSASDDAVVSLMIFDRLLPELKAAHIDLDTLDELCAKEYDRQRSDFKEYLLSTGRSGDVRFGYPVNTRSETIG